MRRAIPLIWVLLAAVLMACAPQRQPDKPKQKTSPLDGAITSLEEAVTQRPDDVGYRVRLAQKYEQKAGLDKNGGWTEKAAESFQKVVELAETQKQPLLYTEAASFYLRQGQPEKAEELFTRALDGADQMGSVEDRSRVRHLRAFLEIDQGRHEEALTLLNQAIELLPKNDGQPHLTRARTLHELGRDEEALADIEAALDIVGQPDAHQCDRTSVRAQAAELKKTLSGS